MQSLHRFTKETIPDSRAFQTRWNDLFGTTISNSDSEYFTNQYREMYGKKKTMRKNHRGGSAALTGAPLSYATVPGANVSVYGRFPTEVATDPASIRDLDVFYNSALSRGCGIENSNRTIPVEMGSNKVGGRRNRYTRRYKGGKRRNTYRRRSTFKGGKRRGSTRSTSRRMRGGVLGFDFVKDMGNSLTQFRPVLSSAPPNYGQMALHAYSGNPANVPEPANPTSQVWQFESRGSEGAINPGNITPIMKSMDQLARPTPWQI